MNLLKTDNLQKIGLQSFNDFTAYLHVAYVLFFKIKEVDDWPLNICSAVKKELKILEMCTKKFEVYSKNNHDL